MRFRYRTIDFLIFVGCYCLTDTLNTAIHKYIGIHEYNNLDAFMVVMISYFIKRVVMSWFSKK